MVTGWDGWVPAGRGGMLSCMPFLGFFGIAGSRYRRFSEAGTVYYTPQLPAIGTITYYAPNAALPLSARYDRATYFFTEYNAQTLTYYRFGGLDHSLPGRILRQWDRNGNELVYTYSARTPNPNSYAPLLRKITGDLGGVTPYFMYKAERDAAPVTKIFLLDSDNPANNRAVYFQYQNTYYRDQAFLQKIVYPGGCEVSYGLVDAGDTTAVPIKGTAIRKEVDQEGYATYFYYDNDATEKKTLHKTTEPEGRVTYYQYPSETDTIKTLMQLPASTYRYAQSLLGGMANTRKEADPLGNTTYYEYTSRDLVKRKIEPNGNVTYYEYSAQDALTKRINKLDGGTTEYVYAANGYDMRKELGPRHAAGTFPVVTYYVYDAKRNRIAETDALGGTQQTGRDSLGRVSKERDERGNTTYYNYSATTGAMRSKVDPAGGVTYFKYSSYRALRREVSPRWKERGAYAAFTTYHEYDSLDRRKKTIDPLKGVTYFYYTSRGDLLATKNALNVETSRAYNGLRLPRKDVVKDAAGVVVQTQYFVYDVYKNKIKDRDPLGNWTYYVYDADNRLRKTRDALQNYTYYFYDSVGNRTKVFDARQNATESAYDALSRLRKQKDAVGYVTYYAYDKAGNRTKALDARLNTTYYHFDALDRQKSVRDALGGFTYYVYDAAGNRVRTRDPLLNTTYYFYDGLNRQRTLRDALGNGTYFGYDAAGNQRKVRDARLNTTYYFYDALDRQRGTRDAVGNLTYFGYDAVGNQRKVRNPRLNTTYYHFDALNRQKDVRNALGGFTYYFYDAAGNTTRVRDARLNTTYHFYDVLNRGRAVRDALANHTYFYYDAVGNRIKERDARQNYTYYFYDANNRLTRQRDALANATDQGYDSIGNRTRIVSPRAYATYFGYDALNRLRGVTNAEGGSSYYTYDAAGNVTRVQDAIGDVVYYGYDALNRLTRMVTGIAGYGIQAYGTTPYGGGGGGVAQYFKYDAVGNRRAEVDGRWNSTYFNYDALNRLSGVADPLGASSSYLYDANSNLRGTVDNAGTRVYFRYDALDRRTKITYPTTAQYFEYDAVGNLTKMVDGWGTTNVVYDKLDRVYKRRSPKNETVYYWYDAVSSVTRIRYPKVTSAAYYVYDNAQRMRKVNSPEGHSCYYNYDVASNVVKKVFGNGAICYYVYDKADRVKNIRHVTSAGVAIAYFDYGRDAAGKITKIGREVDCAVYYTYDSMDRLTGEVWRRKSNNGQIYGFWYNYDNASNRTRMRREFAAGVEWESAYYVYDKANALFKRQVQPASVTTYYKYDLNGSLRKEWDGSKSTYYDYGPHGLITKITPPPADGNPWQFYYDGQLNRHKIDKGGTFGYYRWDNGNLLEERNAAGNIVARYTHGYTTIPGIGSVVECQRVTATTTYYQYHHMDHRGTVYAVTDPSQGAMLRYFQDAFGRQVKAPTGTTPSLANDQIYQCNWMTHQIGNITYCISQYRPYLPTLGLYCCPDFVRSYDNKRRSSVYVYCLNAPTNFVDVLGLTDTQLPGGAQSLVDHIIKLREQIASYIQLLKSKVETAKEHSPTVPGYSTIKDYLVNALLAVLYRDSNFGPRPTDALTKSPLKQLEASVNYALEPLIKSLKEELDYLFNKSFVDGHSNKSAAQAGKIIAYITTISTALALYYYFSKTITTPGLLDDFTLRVDKEHRGMLPPKRLSLDASYKIRVGSITIVIGGSITYPGRDENNNRTKPPWAINVGIEFGGKKTEPTKPPLEDIPRNATLEKFFRDERIREWLRYKNLCTPKSPLSTEDIENKVREWIRGALSPNRECLSLDICRCQE
jgi:YD repeat-containing protein